MQFLSDIFIRCPDCNGRRYRPHILEVKLAPADKNVGDTADRNVCATNRKPSRSSFEGALRSASIADLLEATVDEAIEFLGAFAESRPAQRAAASLRLLQEVGLGYLKLGQPLNTLSGGEGQRLKLVRHMAEVLQSSTPALRSLGEGGSSNDRPPVEALSKPFLFLFDEPTTGLHFDDVQKLLHVLNRLTDLGNTVIIIEHHLDVIKTADWVIDLGPGGGAHGGSVMAAGTPEQVAGTSNSHTGQALAEVLK